MKYIKLFEEQANKNDVVTFLNDFGMFITMNLAKVGDLAIDSDSKTKLLEMQNNLRKPIINGKNFIELINDIYPLIKDPKMLSGLFSQIRDIIVYIEPRIERYVQDSNYKTIWLNKLTDFKSRYKNIVL